MLPESLHLCGGYGLYELTVVLEEVVVEYLGDTQELFCVDSGATENLVDVGTVATQLACEPTDRALLSANFFFDEMPYVRS